MPAMDDRWDVVVTGLRDPSHAAAMMAVAELAHYASLPPQDVERMLDEGELVVMESLDRAEAERAAYELAELGAVVDLRLGVGNSGVFPVFKPDAERQIGVAVGGLIDDSATPPTVGAAVGLPQLEPDLEAPKPPRTRPPSTRPPAASASGSGRMPVPIAGPPGLDEEPRPPPRAAEPSRGGDVGARPRGPTPAPGRPEPARPRVQTPAPGRPDESTRGRAQTPGPARPQEGAPDIESLLGDVGSAAAPPAPKLPQRLQRATAAAKEGGGEIELDFAAAGMVPPALKRGPAVAPTPVAPAADRSASNMPRRTRAGHMGGTGASAAGHVHHGGGLLETLRNDGIAALLVGLGVGLALSLVLALQIQRSGVRDRLPPLEEELVAALSDPTGVAAGKRRAPAAIEEELDGALGELQRSFLLWWLAPGAVVGVLLSRLKQL